MECWYSTRIVLKGRWDISWFKNSGGSTKFENFNANKCKLANSFLKPTDKIVSSATHRTYSCTNHEKSYVTCNSFNIIYLIACLNCFIQYVGETVQQLNIRFATHRGSMSGKLQSNSCKWLAEYFSTGICKNTKYSVQIIEKQQGNGRTSGGAIDLGEAVLRRKREAECMLKLRNVYPYGLKEKVDICEDNKNMKRFKSDYGIVGTLFTSLPRLFQRDQTRRHANRKRISI